MASKIIQKKLEKKNKQTNKQKQNKNKCNVILKKQGVMGNFMSKIKQRKAEISLFKNCEFWGF